MEYPEEYYVYRSDFMKTLFLGRFNDYNDALAMFNSVTINRAAGIYKREANGVIKNMKFYGLIKKYNALFFEEAAKESLLSIAEYEQINRPKPPINPPDEKSDLLLKFMESNSIIDETFAKYLKLGSPKQTYDKVDYIGGGSFGKVFKVSRKSDGIIFIMKEQVARPVDVPYIKSEFLSVMHCNHPNIIKNHEIYLHGDKYNIIMDYAEGISLHQRINSNDYVYNENESIHILSQLCSAIAHLHENHIIHRDLKSLNIVISNEDNSLKLVDFGIAKFQKFGEIPCFPSTYIGTTPWMSPERLRMEKYDHTADIWSIGCIAYELITLTPPFFKDGASGRRKLIEGELPPIDSLPISSKMKKFLSSCLTLPDQRKSASALVEILQSI